MELSENTLNVLKNFATINPSIKIVAGKTIATVAEAKNILAKAEIEDEFPQEFGIYDLNSFLSAVSLMDKATLDFSEKFVTIKDSTGRVSVKYFFDMTQEKGKTDIVMPESPVKFTLTADTLSKIKRAASTLGHDQVVVSPNKLTVMNVENPTSNTYEMSIEFDKTPDDIDYKFIFNIANLKMMAGDYEVEISEKLISHFSNGSIEYFVAVERTSTYN